MIKKIHLENFKCFRKLDYELKNVNILTGLNGMGKSTIIQSLLLIYQSLGEIMIQNQVKLNGDMIDFGTGRDILCESTEDDSAIVIGVEEDDRSTEVRMLYAPFSNVLRLQEGLPVVPKFTDREHFIFLSADRIVPVNIYDITNDTDLQERNFGNNGVYTLQYLKEYGPNVIDHALVYTREGYVDTLYEQVRFWMSKIAPGVSIEIDIDPEKQLASLGYSFQEGKNVTNTYKSVNVGFGITYVLPVVVALLSARKGDTILIENPEAHIHPAGQRWLGELIAWVGRINDVQVLVETHSDHILNGIRVAVKQKRITKEKVNLSYFYKDGTDGFQHKVITPHLTDEGRIDEWPKGFFDEWDNALLDLL